MPLTVADRNWTGDRHFQMLQSPAEEEFDSCICENYKTLHTLHKHINNSSICENYVTLYTANKHIHNRCTCENYVTLYT